MQIITPSVELWKHDVHPYEFMEKVGRVCYKSEDKITEGSAVKMMAALKKSKHYAILEHEHLYFEMSERFMNSFLADMRYIADATYENPLKYFNVTNDTKFDLYILSGSFRSFIELFEKGYEGFALDIILWNLQNNYTLIFGDDDINAGDYIKTDCKLITREDFETRYADYPDVLHNHLIHTFKFITNIAITHEFVRHRPASYAQESTRFINYIQDKFGSEITVIEPFFFTPDGVRVSVDNWSERYGAWRHSCEVAEESYFRIINDGGTPQEAATVLPKSTKTELVVTATEKEWQHIVNLRYLGTTGAPHPQMKEVMGMAVSDIKEETNGRVYVGELAA